MQRFFSILCLLLVSSRVSAGTAAFARIERVPVEVPPRPEPKPLTPTPEPTFLRGDTNGDHAHDLSDGIKILDYLFLGGGKPPCLKAADADDDDTVTMTDCLAILRFLYDAGEVLPPPFATCGVDPTQDELDCASSACPSKPAAPELSVTGVDPLELEPLDAERLFIYGTGFGEQSMLEFSVGQDTFLLPPTQVDADRLELELSEGWYERFTTGVNEEPGPLEIRDSGPQHFSVRVVHPDVSSNAAVFLVNRSRLRFTRAVVHEALLRGGNENSIDLELQRRQWKDTVEIEVRTYRAPGTATAELDSPLAYLPRVHGIGAVGLLGSGVDSATLPLDVSSHVPVGEYVLVITARPEGAAAELARTTARVTVTSPTKTFEHAILPDGGGADKKTRPHHTQPRPQGETKTSSEGNPSDGNTPPPPAPMADLGLRIAFDPSSLVEIWQPFGVYYEIRNYGTSSSGPYTCTVQAHGVEWSESMDALAPGEDALLWKPYSGFPAVGSPYRFKLKVTLSSPTTEDDAYPNFITETLHVQS